MLVNSLVDHVASGRVFFTGVFLLMLVLGGLDWLDPRSPRRRWLFPPTLLGLIGIGVSATPLPWWLYALLIAALLIWLLAEVRVPPERPRRRSLARLLFLFTLVGAVVWEVPFHLAPELPSVSNRAIAVIGDSITADTGEREAVTWPRLLQRVHGLEVHDFSTMGATVESALDQAEKIAPQDHLVILEIGGDNLLGQTSPADFENGLENLLKKLQSPGRVIVMFELPLSPGKNAYGAIQRRLARRWKAHLIPKRELMAVLSESRNTSDSVHLTQAGHAQLAATVWRLIEPALPPPKPPAPNEQ